MGPLGLQPSEVTVVKLFADFTLDMWPRDMTVNARRSLQIAERESAKKVLAAMTMKNMDTSLWSKPFTKAWAAWWGWQNLVHRLEFEYCQRMSAIEVGLESEFIDVDTAMILRIEAAWEQREREVAPTTDTWATRSGSSSPRVRG
jgi:hypothetical protein